jgi:hypothetical protein
MTNVHYHEILRTTLIGLELTWGTRPIVILACAGYADEHWQIYHPDELLSDNPEPMPHLTINIEGRVEYHPDGSTPEQQQD